MPAPRPVAEATHHRVCRKHERGIEIAVLDGRVAEGQVGGGRHTEARFEEAAHLQREAGGLAQLRYFLRPMEARGLAQLDIQHLAGLQLDKAGRVVLVAAAFGGHDWNGRGRPHPARG